VTYHGRRHGALAVVEQGRSREDINRRLKSLNEGLFVELQRRQADVDEYGRPLYPWGEGQGVHAYYDVWTVCLEAGSDGIVPLFEWRESQPAGPPIPYLSEGIVEEMARRYQRGPVSVAEVKRQNSEKEAADRQQFRDDAEALIDEHLPLINAKRAYSGPRGPYLRRARQRYRDSVAEGKAPKVHP